MNTLTQRLLTGVMIGGLLVTVVAAKAHADGSQMYGGDGGCVPVYGGGVSCPRPGEVLLDKSVRNPSTGVFVDNLDLADPKYHPTDIVTFRITLRNSGEETLSEVRVVDTLPSFVDYSSGPSGSTYDESTRQVKFEAHDILPGATQTHELKVRVVHVAALPEGKNIVCPLNVVEASTTDQSDRDDSKFCIEKEMEVPVVPKAGPEQWVLSILGLGASLKAGLVLRKKSKDL